MNRIALRATRPTSVPWHRLVVLAGLVALTPSAGQSQRATPVVRRSMLAAVKDTALLQRILIVEDTRTRDAAGLDVLRDGLRSAEAPVRRVAIRAIGRMQRPELVSLLTDSAWRADTQMSWETIDALGQAAQGIARGDVERARADVDSIASMLTASMRNASNRIVAARTLGRLPYSDSAQARQAERTIRQWIESGGEGRAARGPSRFNKRLPVELADPVHGLYGLARRGRALGPLDDSTTRLLRTLARYRFIDPSGSSAMREQSARVRRLALLALGATGPLDSAATVVGLSDDDAQVRRIALSGMPAIASPAVRSALFTRAFGDTAAMVRLEATRVYARLSRERSCAPLLARVRDIHPHVMLAAVDALGGACPDSTAARGALRARLRALPAGLPTTGAENRAMHGAAHAIVSLAVVAPDEARDSLARVAEHPAWVARQYAARAAATLADTATLRALAERDSAPNVRETAIEGLARVAGRTGDEIYLGALSHPAYQVVLAAAQALSGTSHPEAQRALYAALERISAERRETSRDARMAILARLDSLGGRDGASRLSSYRMDFDTTVAATAAALQSRWTGQVVSAAAAPLPIAPEPLARIAMASDLVLRITMDSASGGGSFAVRLFSDVAPATVARIIRLAQAGYYDGLTLHRLASNFVLQGGSPAANEYVGDGPFMRDELSLEHHTRGTLGISTRGRDTGDAQIFVNLIDNFRLDHDYTVLGEIFDGRRVAERTLEGDVMASVRVEGSAPLP